MERTTSLDEYQKLITRMDSPGVVVDNAVSPTATIIKVDGSMEHRDLLGTVQALTDLNLLIRKAYIQSDGGWFMHVFHVTDRHGRKLRDKGVFTDIEVLLGRRSSLLSGGAEGLTALELRGFDRPGLLSEIFAVLTDLGCDVVDATVWTHDGRFASIIFLRDETFGSPIDDSKLRRIELTLYDVLQSGRDVRGAGTTMALGTGVTHPERRLHQMMFEDHDYEPVDSSSSAMAVSIWAQNLFDWDYLLVNVQCRNRPKLLFDIVCSLTDMKYVIYHGNIDVVGDQAYQEFYIRRSDRKFLSSEAERKYVIQCLRAAVERRADEGSRLNLCTMDRPGLLADVTRIFRESGLSVRQAEVSTKGQMAVAVFYVTDVIGQPADPNVLETVRQVIGLSVLKVGEEESKRSGAGVRGAVFSNLGSLVKRNLYNRGLFKADDKLGEIDDALDHVVVSAVSYIQSHPQVGSTSFPLEIVVPTKGSFMLSQDTNDHVMASWGPSKSSTTCSITRDSMLSEESIFSQVSFDRALATQSQGHS